MEQIEEKYFQYGDQEISYLKKKDKRLAEVIDKVGFLKRLVIPDIFTALVHSIVGQQISTKAHETVWRRVQSALGSITPEAFCNIPDETLRKAGLSLRKVGFIKNAAQKIMSGEVDITSLADLDNDNVCSRLCSLDGIGRWSAEMLLLFSMQRPDVLSYGDLGIQRGLRMIYRHRRIDRKLFEKYRRRFSPFCSVASLYIWAVAGGAVEGYKDYAPKKPAGRK